MVYKTGPEGQEKVSRSSLPIKAGPEIFAHREKGDRIPINRFVVIILDSIGVGELPDAAAYGDVGSHTLGNMARTVGGLKVPHLEAMGLGNIVIAERGGPADAANGRL
jgi:hypothetical protein